MPYSNSMILELCTVSYLKLLTKYKRYWREITMEMKFDCHEMLLSLKSTLHEMFLSLKSTLHNWLTDFRNFIYKSAFLCLISFKNLEFYIHSFDLPVPLRGWNSSLSLFYTWQAKNTSKSPMTTEHFREPRIPSGRTEQPILSTGLDFILLYELKGWKPISHLLHCSAFSRPLMCAKWRNMLHTYRTSCNSRRLKFHTWPGSFAVKQTVHIPDFCLY